MLARCARNIKETYAVQVLEEDISEEIFFHAPLGLNPAKDPSVFISMLGMSDEIPWCSRCVSQICRRDVKDLFTICLSLFTDCESNLGESFDIDIGRENPATLATVNSDTQRELFNGTHFAPGILP
jgi:hypothetical protein